MDNNVQDNQVQRRVDYYIIPIGVDRNLIRLKNPVASLPQKPQ